MEVGQTVAASAPPRSGPTIALRSVVKVIAPDPRIWSVRHAEAAGVGALMVHTQMERSLATRDSVSTTAASAVPSAEKVSAYAIQSMCAACGEVSRVTV